MPISENSTVYSAVCWMTQQFLGECYHQTRHMRAPRHLSWPTNYRKIPTHWVRTRATQPFHQKIIFFKTANQYICEAYKMRSNQCITCAIKQAHYQWLIALFDGCFSPNQYEFQISMNGMFYKWVIRGFGWICDG